MLKRNKLKFLWLYEASKKAGKGKKTCFLFLDLHHLEQLYVCPMGFPGPRASIKLNLKDVAAAHSSYSYEVIWVTRTCLLDRRGPESQV